MSLAVNGNEIRTAQRNQYVQQFIERQLPRTSTSSRYDSVVIAGNGIGAQVFAAQLAKNPQFEGKVTLVAPAVSESRRLINGVSLRGSAADFLCSALGTDHESLLAVSAGTSSPAPAAYRQTVAAAIPSGNSWHIKSPGTWQGGNWATNPIIYGVRNSRLVAGMRELLADHPISFIEDKVQSADELRSYAEGTRPLLVNATPNPTLFGGESRKPRRLVLAVQAPMIEKKINAPLEVETAFAPIIRRDNIIDVGYFTPFADPLSPRSTWYGILARVVDADSGFHKEHELDVMTDELGGLAESMGLEIDDPSETLARALVPASPWGKVTPSQPGTLDLKRMYSGGAPCYYADGMVSSAIGGVIGAEAVVRGVDADQAIRAALRPFRRHNYLWWIETTKTALFSDYLLRLNPRAAMLYPHTAGLNLWQSAA
ncbi:hypothetical protein [Rhodococcus zopfii]|uniref:hypothetical protein n=1 Tax=Rhodococcus zopfii TaxID=43772 RepID=UPI000AC6AE45|nr:hypothetical protein [Rhodococcus zopfii]